MKLYNYFWLITGLLASFYQLEAKASIQVFKVQGFKSLIKSEEPLKEGQQLYTHSNSKSQIQKSFFSITSTFNIHAEQHAFFSMGYGELSWYPGDEFMKYFHISKSFRNVLKSTEGFLESSIFANYVYTKDQEFIMNAIVQTDINFRKNQAANSIIPGITTDVIQNFTFANQGFRGDMSLGISAFIRYIFRNTWPVNFAISLSAGAQMHLSQQNLNQSNIYFSYPITLGFRRYF